MHLSDPAGSTRDLKIRRSPDHGQTFGAAVIVSPVTYTGDGGSLQGGLRNNEFPMLALGPAVNGISPLYAVWNDGRRRHVDRADTRQHRSQVSRRGGARHRNRSFAARNCRRPAVGSRQHGVCERVRPGQQRAGHFSSQPGRGGVPVPKRQPALDPAQYRTRPIPLLWAGGGARYSRGRRSGFRA